jgi:hypothetical protein
MKRTPLSTEIEEMRDLKPKKRTRLKKKRKKSKMRHRE